jgi:hypothetical protein
MSNSTVAHDRPTTDSAVLQFLARVGLVGYGLVHLVIGVLALQIAWGASAEDSANLTGALRTIAKQPFGGVLLWAVAIGLVALAVWQGSEALFGHRQDDGAERVRKHVRSVCKCLFYAALGISAASIALGWGSPGSQSQEQTTTGVLAWPGGEVIVVVAGLIVVGIGVAGIVQGVRKSFLERLDEEEMSAAAKAIVERLGQIGFIVKGLVLVLIGGLLGYAALTFDPEKASGLNGAVYTILAQPFGRFVLTAMALGFVCFGLYQLGASRYRRM